MRILSLTDFFTILVFYTIGYMKIFYTLLLVFIFFSCGDQRGKEFEYSGGAIRMCLENEPSTYIPYETEDYYSSTVLRQVMEGLVRINPKTTKIEGQIASKWTVSDDGLVYTFTIRDDILFHPHDLLTSESDRKLTVEDVVRTFEKICSKGPDGLPTNGYDYVFKNLLVGAADFLSGKADKIKGLKAGKGKVTLELLHRDDNFLYKLGSVQAAILSAKIIDNDRIADMIGTGPFMFSEHTTGEMPRIVLVKNPDYYEIDEDGYQLPFLSSVEFIIQNRKLEQLDMFEERQIDLILGLPTSRITKMLEGRIEDFNSKPPKLFLYKNPVLATNYYFFNMNDPRFRDPKVRQAFNYAINRDKIGREVLRNQYDELGYYGIVPPINQTFRGYDFNSVKKAGYDYDPEKAKKLLAEAGYPNGEGFGSVTLRFNIGDVNSAVADEFAQQIFQVLGINVNIDGSTFDQLNDDASYSRGDIFRSAWGADYPNPETFLNNFYGTHIPMDSLMESGINQSRYRNPNFDRYLEQAKETENIGEKMKLYSKAEVELMKNPPIIPLWYNGDMQIVYSNVRNLHFNSLSIFDFKTVYLKDWTKQEYLDSLSEKE